MHDRFDTPHGFVVLVPVDDVQQAGLRDDERALSATYAERRMRTFVAGRAALRSALGVDVAIGRTDRGAPVLPPGWIGSITHKDEVAGALVRRVADDEGAHTVGVDLELAHEKTRDIASHVLLPHEIEALAHLDEAARAREVLTRFSLKEAFYKAIDPRVRRFVGFHEVAVEMDGERARFVTSVITAHAEGLVWRRGDVIVTTVSVRW